MLTIKIKKQLQIKISIQLKLIKPRIPLQFPLQIPLQFPLKLQRGCELQHCPVVRGFGVYCGQAR